MKATITPDFETLVDSYYQLLLKFAVSLCGELESALELTQRTFLLALRRDYALRRRQQTKRWLFTILFSEFLRKRQLGSRSQAAAQN